MSLMMWPTVTRPWAATLNVGRDAPIAIAGRYVILAVWCLVLFVYGLDAGPLYRTESLRAIIGAECLRGHWLFPVLYGEPFLTKPPGQYVAIGLCSLPFGEVTAASARVPSVIAATLAVLLVAGLFRRVLGDHAGWLAGFLLPTSVLWLDKVPSAEIDMSLLGWVTASLVLAYRAIDAKARPVPRAGLWGASLLCLALGTLTKWTAPAFFGLTLLPFLIWQRQLRVLMSWPFLLATSLAVALCGVWALAVANDVGWSTLVDTIRSEASYRFHPAPKAKGYPWGEVATYPLVVWAAHLPLSLFALATLRPRFFQQWDDAGRSLLRFLHCWAWPSLLFWAIVPNHNVRYALPISPALMGLGVMGLWAWLRQCEATGLQRAKIAVVAFLVLWLIAKIVFVEVVVPQRASKRNAEPIGLALRTLIPPGEPVYLLRLKDEGVLFYFGRPALRCRDPRTLPRPAYVLLREPEWHDRSGLGDVELVQWMYDQQGDPLIVAKVK